MSPVGHQRRIEAVGDASASLSIAVELSRGITLDTISACEPALDPSILRNT